MAAVIFIDALHPNHVASLWQSFDKMRLSVGSHGLQLYPKQKHSGPSVVVKYPADNDDLPIRTALESDILQEVDLLNPNAPVHDAELAAAIRALQKRAGPLSQGPCLLSGLTKQQHAWHVKHTGANHLSWLFTSACSNSRKTCWSTSQATHISVPS